MTGTIVLGQREKSQKSSEKATKVLKYDQLQWTNEIDVSKNIVYEYEYNIKYINDKHLI